MDDLVAGPSLHKERRYIRRSRCYFSRSIRKLGEITCLGMPLDIISGIVAGRPPTSKSWRLEVLGETLVILGYFQSDTTYISLECLSNAVAVIGVLTDSSRETRVPS